MCRILTSGIRAQADIIDLEEEAEEMDVESIQTNFAAKIPMLK